MPSLLFFLTLLFPLTISMNLPAKNDKPTNCKSVKPTTYVKVVSKQSGMFYVENIRVVGLNQSQNESSFGNGTLIGVGYQVFGPEDWTPNEAVFAHTFGNGTFGNGPQIGNGTFGNGNGFGNGTQVENGNGFGNGTQIDNQPRKPKQNGGHGHKNKPKKPRHHGGKGRRGAPQKRVDMDGTSKPIPSLLAHGPLSIPESTLRRLFPSGTIDHYFMKSLPCDTNFQLEFKLNRHLFYIPFESLLIPSKQDPNLCDTVVQVSSDEKMRLGGPFRYHVCDNHEKHAKQGLIGFGQKILEESYIKWYNKH